MLKVFRVMKGIKRINEMFIWDREATRVVFPNQLSIEELQGVLSLLNGTSTFI